MTEAMELEEMLDSFDQEERRVALNAASKYGALALSMIARFFMTPYLVHTVGKTHGCELARLAPAAPAQEPHPEPFTEDGGQ